MNSDKAQIFISYSHLDEEYKDKLNLKLKVLEREGRLKVWTDREIGEGNKWLPEIEAKLNSCDVAVLLISDYFLTSDFIMDKEVPLFLDRREHHNLKLYPLIIDHCNWQNISWLSELAGAMKDNIPLSEDKESIGKKLTELVNRIDKYCSSLNKKSSTNYTAQKSPFNIPFESKGEGAIGLEEKLQEVDNALNDTKSHRANIGQVASFQGMGGLGKTQLAVEYAHRYREDYDGVVWLTVDQDIDRQIIELAESMGWVAKEIDAKSKLDTAKSKYASLENTLLVYDNVENYTTEVEPRIPKANNNKILLTSRSAIRGFTTVELLTLDDENAIKLLKYESKREINPEDNTWVEKIVQALDGLPLALEMVGAYMLESELSWQEYWELFDAQSVVLLERSDIPGSGTNHESNISKTLSIGQSILDKTPLLTAIIQLLAFGSVEPMDKLLLSKMLDVTQAEIADAISYGVKLRFIKKEEEEGKPLYTLHRLVREVWRAQHTVEDDFTQKVSKALADYLREIKDEFLNLSQLEMGAFQSIVWADRVKENALSALLVNYAAYPHYHLSDYKKVLTLVRNAHAKIDKNNDTQAYAEILNSMGFVLKALGDANGAKPYYQEALEMRQRLYTGDHPPCGRLFE